MGGIYLSLGSNIGDRARNIARALELLAGRGVRVVRRSALYETEPVEMRAQEWFLNCVVEVEVETEPLGREGLGGGGALAPQHLTPHYLPPQQLMQALLEIERSMGRERVPFAEIVPDAVHPVLKKTIRELLSETRDRSEVRRVDETST